MSEPDNIVFPFDSQQHLAIARALKVTALKKIAASPELGGAEVAEALEETINNIWRQPAQADEPPMHNHPLRLEQLNEAQKAAFMEGFARLGHLYEIAGLTARENYFHSKGKPPGGPQDMIEAMNGMPVKSIIEAISKPVFEMILTQHPTNTNALSSIQLQRQIGSAIKKRDTQKLEEAIGSFMSTPLLHQVNGRDSNFTVRDETEIVLNALSNVYDDLPAVYKEFDDALIKKSSVQHPYSPLDLQLKLRFGSWGSSGDKDGNNSVTAETTLEAIILHKRDISLKYAESLNTIIPQMQESGHRGVLQNLADVFRRDTEGLSDLLPQFAKARRDMDGRTLLPEKEFDVIKNKVLEIDNASAEIKTLLPQALKDAYLDDKSSEPVQEELLNLIRRHRAFGFGFGKIEYRETADEYSRVVGLAIPEYARLLEEEEAEKKKEGGIPDKNAAQKQKILENIFLDPAKMEEMKTKLQGIAAANAQKSYDEADAGPIAYHTLKRMELARDFPDMIADNVLAECQGVHNMLEAKLVQLIAGKDGKAPLLGIIPLFEEPKTMENIENIMQKIYQSPAYEKHLHALAQARNEPVTQQVQIAHSDNARRAGVLAARGFIHRAHKALRALHAEHFPDIALQFYEGGSVSDAYRNGTRAVSGTVDDFQLYDFAKFTFQGGDLVNYLNQSSSIVRLLSRNIAHSARRLQQLPGGALANKNGDDRLPASNEIADRAAIAALTETLKQYESQDFGAAENPMGALLAVLDYAGESRAGNRGSRSASRSNKKKPANEGLQEVPVDKIRTIAFSEAWQHNGVIPIWIGGELQMRHIRTYLDKEMQAIQSKKNPLSAEEQDFLTAFSDIQSRGGLFPEHVKKLYDMSRVFRDAMDRAAYGIAMTDTNTFDWLNVTLQPSDSDKHSGRTALVKKVGLEYLERLKNTFTSLAPLTAAAVQPRAKSINWSLEERQKDSPREAQGLNLSALENLKNETFVKRAYRDVLLMFRHGLKRDEHSDAYWHTRGILHNAGDTVVHGRVLTADDPRYGKALRESPAITSAVAM